MKRKKLQNIPKQLNSIPFLICMGICVIVISLYMYVLFKTEKNVKYNDEIVNTVDTKGMIRILENELVKIVSTSHSNAFYIELEDGSKYKGVYKQSETDDTTYSKNPYLDDVLSVVSRIHGQRKFYDNEMWIIVCE